MGSGVGVGAGVGVGLGVGVGDGVGDGVGVAVGVGAIVGSGSGCAAVHAISVNASKTAYMINNTLFIITSEYAYILSLKKGSCNRTVYVANSAQTKKRLHEGQAFKVVLKTFRMNVYPGVARTQDYLVALAIEE